MSLTDVMSKIGFIKKIKQDDSCAVGGEVEIQDGKIIGNPYCCFDNSKDILNYNSLSLAYERISCVGSSIDLISDNMQMIEPVFWNDEQREAVEYPKQRKLKTLRKLFEKPNAIDNRKTFLDKAVKNYELYGAIYFAFVLSDTDIVSIKIIENGLVTAFEDVSNARIGSYQINNSGIFSGTYIFNGAYYIKDGNEKIILAPLINSSPSTSYLPSSPLAGTGIEALMYWYGCFHNQNLLKNGARPSFIVMIKSLLNPKHREELRNEIKIRHAGAKNAGSAIIIDGAAEKEIKQLSQNNKDMEFTSTLSVAEEAVYKRLGTNWVLGKNVSSKDYSNALEMFYDMTICPLFQRLYNHLFDIYKYYNSEFDNYSIFYLEEDIPALRNRFLKMMSQMPQMGIFTIKERRKMYHYQPLGDERDDELTVQSVKVVQSGMSPDKENTTSFSGSEE